MTDSQILPLNVENLISTKVSGARLVFGSENIKANVISTNVPITEPFCNET